MRPIAALFHEHRLATEYLAIGAVEAARKLFLEVALEGGNGTATARYLAADARQIAYLLRKPSGELAGETLLAEGFDCRVYAAGPRRFLVLGFYRRDPDLNIIPDPHTMTRRLRSLVPGTELIPPNEFAQADNIPRGASDYEFGPETSEWSGFAGIAWEQHSVIPPYSLLFQASPFMQIVAELQWHAAEHPNLDDIREIVGRHLSVLGPAKDDEAEVAAMAVSAVRNRRCYGVNFKDDDYRSWDDAVRYGFVSAGTGTWYQRSLASVPSGSRIFVNIPRKGFVGVGLTLDRAKPIRQAVVRTDDGIWRSLLNLRLTAKRMRVFANDPQRCEYVIPVEWLVTVPAERAYRAFRANRRVSWQLRPQLTDRLLKFFDLKV